MKKGFTLAEVLITLGVIGVVAAMTLPAVISNYQKETAVTRLKQTYTQISTAVEKIANENGVVGFDAWQCDDDGNSIYWQDRCFHEAMKLIAVKLYPQPATIEQAACYDGTPYKAYTWRNGTLPNANQITSQASWSAALPNGACVIWHPYAWAGDLRGAIIIDVDGSYHGANSLGKDLFEFIYLTPDRGYGYGSSGRMIIPHGAYELDRSTNPGTLISTRTRNQLKGNCKKNGTGKDCAALIMQDGWKIKDDYPW